MILLFGYRVNEKRLEEVVVVDFLPRLKKLKFQPNNDRPVSRSLPCFMMGLALPRVDFKDTYSNIFGMAKRVLRKPPSGNRAVKRRFRYFVRKWIRENLSPLRDPDFSFDPWIEQTSYPETRKEELRRCYEDFINHPWQLPKRVTRVKSFIKDEAYVEYKLPRWINSRSDEFKCLVGPAFSAIEHQLFLRKEFIKYVPVPDRPAFINEHLHRDGFDYFATDFSSFESHFTSEMMFMCEMQLYRYMLSSTLRGVKIHALIQQVLASKAYKLGNDEVVATIKGKRMSGEMCTSLGNGFSNLMLILFACEESLGTAPHGVVVEGDDGLFTVSKDSGISAKTFEDIGFRVKIEKHRSVQTASFCGNIYDYMDQVVLTDPRKVLVNFGWTKREDVKASKSRLALLSRAKGYSIAHQYRGSPILGSFANYILRATRQVDIKLRKQLSVNDKSFSYWDRQKVTEAMEADCTYKPPSMRSREIIAQTYKISIGDQLSLERFFDNLKTLQPIDHEVIRNWDVAFPNWSEYYDTYGLYHNEYRCRKNPALAFAYLQ